MTIALQEFPSRKIINENLPERPKPIDYKAESLRNPVPYIENWGYRRSRNEMNTREGRVFIRSEYGEIIRKRRFFDRTERNNIVNSFSRAVAHTTCYISVEFD